MDTPSFATNPTEQSLAQMIVAVGALTEMIGDAPKDDDKFHEASTQGQQALKHFLEKELERDAGLGREPLPNGKSWIKGLHDAGPELALWWGQNAKNGWAAGDPEHTKGMSACEELIFNMTIQNRRNITPTFAQLIEIGISKGLSLTHTEADQWIYPLSEEQIKRAESAKTLVDRLVEYTRRHPNKEDLPLLRAYVAADGPLSISLSGRAPSLGERPQLTAMHAIEVGYGLTRKSIGKPDGFWWETGLEKFPKEQREELMQLANAQGLDTTRASKTHTYKLAEEIYSSNISSPQHALRAMVDYLSSSKDGIATTTHEGDLVWQRVVSERMGLDNLYGYANTVKELDWSSHTSTSCLVSCAAKFGGLSQVELPSTIRELFARSPVVHSDTQEPLMASLCVFMDQPIQSDIKGELAAHIERHTRAWLGSLEQQRELAKEVLRTGVSTAWLMEAVPAIVSQQDIAAELLWSAKLVSDCCKPSHPHIDMMPAQWPTQLQRVDGRWLNMAWEYAKMNLPAAAKTSWDADFEALEIMRLAPETQDQTRARPRL